MASANQIFYLTFVGASADQLTKEDEYMSLKSPSRTDNVKLDKIGEHQTEMIEAYLFFAFPT